MNTQKQIFLIVVLFFVLTGGCAAYAFIEPVRSERQSDFFDKESIRRGALLFANNCRSCHGNTGEGGVGLPLNIDAFKNQDPLILQQNRTLIQHTLQCGRAGTRMPAWLKANGGALTGHQIGHLINLITAPGTEVDEETGQLTNTGWHEAEEYAHNLNSETSVLVGGDTLDTIAKAHRLGYTGLAEANGVDVEHVFQRGDNVQLPDGRDIELFEDRALRLVADDNHVGAIMLAELNGIGWEVAGTNLVTTVGGEDVTGLLPGEKLKLPEGAAYVVRAEDTLQSIAALHGVTASAIRGLNRENENVQDTASDEVLEHERRLVLPDGVMVVVGEADTFGTIASTHGLELADLLTLNQIAEGEAAIFGEELALPDDTRYIIQAGDTLASVAAAHHLDEAELAELNGLTAGTPIGPEVILQLPNVEEYTVQGQSLADVALGFGNVSASSLAERNEIEADTVLRVGASLHLPDDAWGAAPSSAITSGEVCIKDRIPGSSYDILFGGGPVTDPEAPEEVSTDVQIVAHANDWTIIADGVELEPNRGAVTIASGADVDFSSAEGLHTVTVDGEKDDGDLNTGDERTITFDGDPEQKFVITCDYHPDMKAWVYVQP